MTEHTKEPWDASDKTVYSDAFKSEKNRDGALACLVSSEENDWITVANTLRIVACVNAMQGIDDPEAFMRDVRAFMRNLEFNGEGDWVALGMDINEHLKGGE